MKTALITSTVVGMLVAGFGGGHGLTWAHGDGAQKLSGLSSTLAAPNRTELQGTRLAAAGICEAAQLSVTQDLSSGATGHIGVELRLHNRSAQPCTMKGYPTVVLLDSARKPLLTVLRWGPGGFFNFNRPVRLVTVAPGGNAFMAMGWAQIPETGQSCPPAAMVLVLPPGASSAAVVPFAHGGITVCGGKLSISAVEPTHFLL